MAKKKIENKETDLINLYDSWNSYFSALSENSYNRSNGLGNGKKRLSGFQIDDWFSKSSIASKICSKPAEHMFKQGIDIDHKQSKKIYDLYTKFNIMELLEDAIKYDNAYGGSALIFDIDDGLDDWSEPLQLENIRGLNDIILVDRFFLTPENYSYLKKPEFYSLSEKEIKIHNSRMIVFTGLDSGIRNKYLNQSFGESRIYRCLDELQNYSSGHDAIPEILSRFIEDVFKFKDMTKFIQDETKQNLVLKKVGYLKANKNLLKSLVIDSEDEYQARTVNVTGLDKLIRMIEMRLCAAAEMPHTQLLEEGTSTGLSNNGDNSQESKQWYDWIKSQQLRKLSKPIDYINSIFARLLNLGKSSIKWEFNPLQQETQSQIIDNRNKQADIDKKLNEMGVPKELILEKRLGQGYYSHETNFTPEEMNIIKNSIKNNATNNNNTNNSIDNVNNTDITTKQV